MTTATQPVAGNWTVDTVHSSASFAVKHMVVATFRGSFGEIDAKLDTTGDVPQLTGVVPVASIEVKDENLKGHLLADDFFSAEQNPTITFVSTSFQRDGDAITVEGDLTVKGVTNRVTGTGSLVGPATDIQGDERIGIDLDTVIDRTAYGLNWNAPLPKGGFALANDVTLTVHLELVQA
jgi:polyisoprenoid-binding protein YceI